MKASRALLAAALAGSIGTPPAHAEPALAASTEEYDQHFIGFDDYAVVDPQTGILHKVAEPCEGKYKKPIAAADFYRRVGREDLAQEYEHREARRVALMAAGGAVALATVVATTAIALNGQPGDCDPRSPAFGRCASEASAQARSSVITAALVGAGGVLIGGGLVLAAAATNPHPVDAARMRELADRHNQELKQRLGVSLLPVAAPDRVGLALDMRF